MAYIVTEPCIDVKDGACAQVCPVDCIYEGGRMFYIHPDECINCGLCLSVCPVDAILSDDAAAGRMDFMAINRDFFGADISNIGSPGGWEKWRSTAMDHPQVEHFGR